MNARTGPASDTQLQLTDYAFILNQINRWGKNKFVSPIIEFKGALTSEKLFLINKKIIQVSQDWEKNLTFAEYKAYEERFKHAHWHTPPKEHEFEHAFNKFKAAGLKWEFIIAFETEDADTINFITGLLKSVRVYALYLDQIFSEKQLDTVLEACKNTGVEQIRFGYSNWKQQNKLIQPITDKQVKILIECFEFYKLKILYDLPGDKLSEATAAKLAAIAVREGISISVNECPFFKARQAIERDIQHTPSTIVGDSFHAYTLSDIKRLGEAIKKKYSLSANCDTKPGPPKLALHLIPDHQRTDHLDAEIEQEWMNFYNTLLLDPDVNLTELIIIKPDIKHNIMLALLTALGTNSTIKTLNLQFCYAETSEEAIERETALVAALKQNTTLTYITIIGHNNYGNSIVEALSSHPALVSLTLCHYVFTSQLRADCFNHLLTNTKTLHHLELTDSTVYNTTTIEEMAEGLKRNNTLTSLSLSTLTNKEMGLLACAFLFHKSLTKFCFNNLLMNGPQPLRPAATPEGLYKFIDTLNGSHLLKEVEFEWPEEKSERNERYKTLLENITKRNAERWVIQTYQPYVHAVNALSEAGQIHSAFSIPVRDLVLSYLASKPDDPTPEQIDICNTALRSIEAPKSKPQPESSESICEQRPAPKYQSTISKTDFQEILKRYNSRSWFNWVSFWKLHSTTMRELSKIKPNEEGVITRAQVADAIKKDSIQRLNFFNKEAPKGNKGTDNVIEELRTSFDF